MINNKFDRADQSKSDSNMSYDAFVCYSRQDSVFAEELVKRLTEQGRRISIDRHDIRGGEAWQRKLGSLIQNADNIILLISSDTLKSPYCRWELDHAGTLNKRLINVIVRPDNLNEVPTSVSAIQYINPEGTNSIEQIAEEVIAAIETDQDWAEYHTQLQLRAQAWKDHEGGMLRGAELKLAETLMLKYQGRRPFVTELQSALLLQSHRSAQQRFRWATLALIGVVLLSLFGVSTWIKGQQEEAKRLLSETKNYFNASDIIGAISPIDKLAHPAPLVGFVQGKEITRSGQNLFDFWASRLASLVDIIDQAPVSALLSINGQSVVKLSSGALHALEPKGDYALTYSPSMSAFIYADTQKISVHDPKDFQSLLSIDFKGRSRIVGMFPVEALKLVIIVSERRIVNNDEDEPNSMFTDVQVVFQKTAQTQDILCGLDINGLIIEDTSICRPADHELPSGVAAFSTTLAENYRVEGVGLANGSTHSVMLTSRLDCTLKDECEPASTHLKIDEIGGVLRVSESDSGTVSIPHLLKPIVSPTLAVQSRFPALRPEAEAWVLRSEDATSSLPANKIMKLPALNFSNIEDGDRYKSILEEGFYDGGIFSNGKENIAWGLSVGGNSWLMVIRCQYDAVGLVRLCTDDISLTAIESGLISSPNHRFIAQRVCNSDESSVSVYDMAMVGSRPVSLEAPPSSVLGIAFSPSGNRFAALTDQHQLWIYAINTEGRIHREKIITLPGRSIPVSDETCERGQPIAFADELTVVGVDNGSLLFAANVERGEISWTSKGQIAAISLLEQASQVTVATSAGFFAVNDRNSAAMFDVGTGLPVTDAFNTAMSKDESNESNQSQECSIDKVAIEPNNQVFVTCGVGSEQLFVRKSPSSSTWPPACVSMELLTGLTPTGQRISAADLLQRYRDSKDCMQSGKS